MVHQGQGLALGLEAGEDLARVHAGFDELQGDGATNGGGLFCFPDLAHASRANELAEQEGTEGAAGCSKGVSGNCGIRSGVPFGFGCRRTFAHALSLIERLA